MPRVVRSLREGRDYNTLDMSAIDILLDDPFLGILSGIEVLVKYQDGSQRNIATNEHGMVRVSRNKGDFVDLQFATELREHQLRVFVNLKEASSPSGVWQRLANLGYADEFPPPAEPPDQDGLASAVEEFQSDHGIIPTGELDAATLEALASAYSSSTPWGDMSAAVTDDGSDNPYGEDSKAAVA